MPELPSRIGDYRVLGRVGRGGMAEVVLARRTGGSAELVALKRLLPELARDPDFIRMFVREVKVAATLSHRNIVSVLASGESDGELFLVMELVRGWDLARVLGACKRSGSAMPVPLALHIAAEVAAALAYAHERAVVHRDVSPANVLISADGEVKLTDFGIAKAAQATKTTSMASLKGKIPYMSPEQARGEPIDARSDVFSLGIVLWEMLTARRLFAAKGDQELLALVRSADVPPPSSVRADVGSAVDGLVATALAPAQAGRFASAGAMREAIARALTELDAAPGAAEVGAFLATLELPPPPAPDRSALPELSAAARTAVRWPRALSVALGACAVGAGLRVTTAAPKTRLEVRTRTPGATVAVDGKARGATPLVLDDLPRRAVVITVTGAGAQGLERRVDLATTPNAVLDVELQGDTAPGLR